MPSIVMEPKSIIIIIIVTNAVMVPYTKPVKLMWGLRLLLRATWLPAVWQMFARVSDEHTTSFFEPEYFILFSLLPFPHSAELWNTKI
jgi:hypothetical protein